MSEVERLSGGERIFGEHEAIVLPVDSYVRLPQVRSDANPDLPQIMESIDTHGLLNPIDVARMDPAQLGAYVDFVNRTWRTDVSLESYAEHLQPDGYYYLVVAGHTRTEAIARLQKEHDAKYSIRAKVHPVTTPEEIIALQLDENLHTRPAQEQRAIAVVETYHYGLESGMWSNKAEFLEKSGHKFSRRILNEAMGFAQLPSEARDFVFSRQLSYNAAVALGLATDTILEYTAVRLGLEDIPEEAALEFESAYRHQVGTIIAGISNRSLNGTAAKKYIAGQVSTMRKTMERAKADEAALFNLDMVSAEEQAKIFLRQVAKDHRDALRLHHELVGKDGDEALTDELALRRRVLGSGAVQAL